MSEDEEIKISKQFQRIMRSIKGVVVTVVAVVIFVGGWVLRVESHVRADEFERMASDSAIAELKKKQDRIDEYMKSIDGRLSRIEGRLERLK